jgi:hypothetical protein
VWNFCGRRNNGLMAHLEGSRYLSLSLVSNFLQLSDPTVALQKHSGKKFLSNQRATFSWVWPSKAQRTKRRLNAHPLSPSCQSNNWLRWHKAASLLAVRFISAKHFKSWSIMNTQGTRWKLRKPGFPIFRSTPCNHLKWWKRYPLKKPVFRYRCTGTQRAHWAANWDCQRHLIPLAWCQLLLVGKLSQATATAGCSWHHKAPIPATTSSRLALIEEVLPCFFMELSYWSNSSS